MKIFVSWSKEPSKKIAAEVKHFFEMAIPGVSVWMSEIDISKGARWGAEVAKELDETDLGIVCCTPNNLLEPWLHFEAGALSKSVKNGRVFPLCFGVPFAKLPSTLSQFQSTEFSKDDLWKLVNAINDLMISPLRPPALEAKFSRLWRTFEGDVRAALEEMPPPEPLSKALPTTPIAPPEALVAVDSILSDGEEKVLRILAVRAAALTVGDIATDTQMNIVRVEHYISGLLNKELIRQSRTIIGGSPTMIGLSPRGRAYAVEKNWV